MQVQGPTSLLQLLLAQETKRAVAAPFVPEPTAQPAPAQAQVTTPTQSVQMLVTLATAMQEPERRRRAVREAEKALDALEMLQAALIIGVSSPDPVPELENWSQNRTRPEDPELAEILDEIDLRVQVELAKRERG
jgi:hypothetical protein